MPSSCLTVLGAPKHDKGSIIFVAWLIGLSGFKHIKGSQIPFGTWLGLSCQATSISRLGALDCTVLFTILWILTGSHPLLILSSLNIVIDKRIFIMVASYPQSGKVSTPMALLITRLSLHLFQILEDHFLSLFNSCFSCGENLGTFSSLKKIHFSIVSWISRSWFISDPCGSFSPLV